MNRIGIDLGGTKIEGILLADDQTVIKRKRIPTLQKEGYEAIVKRVSGLIDELIHRSTDDFSVGVCTPGAISKKTGRIKNSNTTCLIDKPLKEDIMERIGHPITMENDANCFTVAEATLGAGRSYPVVFGVIMGTGVGGGIVINGKILPGRTNIAGEWGHHKIDPNGRLCYCGQRGCVETFISGPALERHWTELTGEQLLLPAINKKIIAGHRAEKTLKWKSDFLKNFGLALANVINILDPDAVVLGGGVSNIQFLYTAGKLEVYKYVFSDKVDTPILKNQLGDSAGVFGAALLGL